MKKLLSVVLLLAVVSSVACSDSEPPTPTIVPTTAATTAAQTPTPSATATLVPATQTPLPADTIRVDLNNVAFFLKIVDTVEERGKGLMGVASMPQNDGMLFVFETVNRWNFWMKDTLIPLDMIWLAQDGTIVDIIADVKTEIGKPDSELTIIRPAADAKYTIELNAGSAKRVGLAVGMKVRLPPL